jgi:signal peptidase I
MKSQTSHHSLFITLLSIFLLITGYIMLAPTQLGGAVTYVIVDGNSMEPKFHLGDLVILRTQPAYQVGDAVTYQNAELGRYVFHRIVSMNLDRFVLQGDNNSWLDTYHPNQDEIIGKLWVHIPKLGKAIEWVRAPFHMALTVALLGGVLMSDMIIKPGLNDRKKSKPAGNFGGLPQAGFYTLGFLSLLFLTLSIFSFSRPLTRPAANIPYQQDGNFFYSATGTPGVYDTELVRPGEPIFPKLTCFMNVGFTYNLTGTGLQQVSGSHQMYARVTDQQSGWLRTVPMSQTTAFNGNSYFANSTLDLCQVQSLVTLVEQETGLHPSTYTLEIITHVEVTGNIAGNAVSDSFDPSLIFKFDKAHFYLETSSAQPDPLHSSKQGMAGNLTSQPNTFSVAGLNLEVRMARVISLIGLGFAAFGFILIGMNIYNATSRNQDALIRLKYGAMLVDVQEASLQATASLIDVSSMQDLAKLAERHGGMILHMRKNLSDHYLIQNNGTTYRHIIGTDQTGITQPAPIENKKIEAPKSHRANPIPALSQNKTMRRSAAQHSPMAVMEKAVEPLKNTVQNMTEVKHRYEEPKPVIVENRSVWEERQNKIEAPVSSISIKNRNSVDAVQKRRNEYVIQNGTIEFFSPEPVETVVLSRIKI